MFERAYIELNDRDGNEIHEGDILEGFDRQFVVKFGVVEILRVSPMNEEHLLVDVPCFYFEWTAPDDEILELFPIVGNDLGEHDLETLLIVGSVYKEVGDGSSEGHPS